MSYSQRIQGMCKLVGHQSHSDDTFYMPWVQKAVSGHWPSLQFSFSSFTRSSEINHFATASWVLVRMSDMLTLATKWPRSHFSCQFCCEELTTVQSSSPQMWCTTKYLSFLSLRLWGLIFGGRASPPHSMPSWVYLICNFLPLWGWSNFSHNSPHPYVTHDVTSIVVSLAHHIWYFVCPTFLSGQSHSGSTHPSFISFELILVLCLHPWH